MRVSELPVWRIEMWHLLLMVAGIAILLVARVLDLWGFIIGGLFMGVNFALLGLGLRWTLAPLSRRGRVRAGIMLLVIKMGLFLGLVGMLFTRVSLDGLSFAAGVSCLLVAILCEGLCSPRAAGA